MPATESVACLLEGKFVEAGIDIARCTGMSFAVRNNETYLGDAFIRSLLSADMYVGKGYEPSAGHAGAAIVKIHGTATVDLRIEVGRETAIVVGYLHDVRVGMPVVDIAAKLNAVAHDVELNESTDDTSGLSHLQLLTSAFAPDLHIDSRIGKQDILVPAQVGRGVLGYELFLGYGFNLANFADNATIGIANDNVTIQE